MLIPRGTGSLLIAVLCAAVSSESSAQEIRGRVLDASTGRPIQTAGVFLLAEDNSRVALSIADSLGRYFVSAPRGGSYYLYAQRLGYYETASPLVAISTGSRYEIDLELRPEPIQLDPLLITVHNEELERWLTLRLGQNPNAFFGYRVIQGLQLEEAKLRSEDNTELLRWLYIPVSHAVDVCLGYRMPTIDRATQRIGPPRCGTLYLDGYLVPAEHVDSIDMASIAVVVTFQAPQSVHLFTRTFDWSERPVR